MKINTLDKAEVLIALYNAAKVQGSGFFAHDRNFKLDKEKANKCLSKSTSIDYLNGKVLKIDLNGDELDTYLYNRDNGSDAAENALKPLIEKQTSLTMK